MKIQEQIKQPYRSWWRWAVQGLAGTLRYFVLPERLAGLEKLAQLVSQRCPTFPAPVPDYRTELEAALWWRLGEAYQNKDNDKALEWYEKALTQLGYKDELRDATARICCEISHRLYEEKKYIECKRFSIRAIELKPDYAWAYNLRGIAYNGLKEHSRAIQDYDHGLQLDPNYANAYINRGNAYAALKEHSRAIQDYDHALQLNPNDADAYSTLGFTYLWLKDARQARADYYRSWELDPTDVNKRWMAEWAQMVKDHIGVEVAERLEQIVTVESQQYEAYVCRGVALGLRNKLHEGLTELEQAISLYPEMWDAYFWKGMICVYLGRNSVAVEAIEKAVEVELPPLLLTPLYWLERDRPDFFKQYAGPLLAKYGV